MFWIHVFPMLLAATALVLYFTGKFIRDAWLESDEDDEALRGGLHIYSKPESGK